MSAINKRDELVGLQDLIQSHTGKGTPIRLNTVRDLIGSLSEDAIKSNVIEPVGINTQISCPHCEHTHKILLSKIAGKEIYEGTCLVAGAVNYSTDALREYQLNNFRFLKWIASACKTQLPRHLVRHAGGHLVEIGLIPSLTSNDDIMVHYADGLENDAAFAAVLESLRVSARQGPGIIITSCNLPTGLPLPRSHRFIGLANAFLFEDDKLKLNMPSIEQLLGLTPERKHTGHRGQIGISHSVWTSLKDRKDWPEARESQIDLMIEHWPPEKPFRGKRSTLANHLPKFERGEYPRSTN